MQQSPADPSSAVICSLSAVYLLLPLMLLLSAPLQELVCIAHLYNAGFSSLIKTELVFLCVCEIKLKYSGR